MREGAWLSLICVAGPAAPWLSRPSLRAESGARVVASLQPAPNPALPVLTADPPLIAAWLVGLHAQPKPKGKREIKSDVYEKVTTLIVAELEKGVRPWHKPWYAENTAGRITRPLRANGVPYRGINVLMLWAAATEAGFASPTWITFRQAQELGAHVRKGEKGSLVVYANTLSRTEEDPNTGEETERNIPFLKGYTVFNVEQVEGLPERYHPAPPPPIEPVQRIAHCEAFFAATGAQIRHGGNRAFFSPAEDRVQMPAIEAFETREAYYATLAHEMTHWTKMPLRLDRDFGRKRFGDAGYAMEELVAELGAAFLCADLSLSPEPREEHAAYLGHWLKVLKQDKRAIFSGASHAQRAADYLNGLQPNADRREAA